MYKGTIIFRPKNQDRTVRYHVLGDIDEVLREIEEVVKHGGEITETIVMIQ